MADNRRILVFGPAYLDIVVEIDRPLVPEHPARGRVLLDQSAPATHTVPGGDGVIHVLGPAGDALHFTLPLAHQATAATYHLCEPVLARVCPTATQSVHAEHTIVRYSELVGGMGAGYARAVAGVLRMPFGQQDGAPDAVAARVLALLAHYHVAAAPCYLPGCASDTSLVILSSAGDKLAIGVREAMVCWRATPEDRALVAQADALIFCGAPNALLAEVLCWHPEVPVMCAPNMRNVEERAVPLAALAQGIHYLTLNALEWARLADRERLRDLIPVITVTDGPHGSQVYYHGHEQHIPAAPFEGIPNTNRAGETYGATVFQTLLREQPDFTTRGITHKMAALAGQRAARQAARQLALRGFDFPPDDWS